MSTDTAKALLRRDRPAAWAMKYAIRTRRGYIQRIMEHESGTIIYLLTPELEKALLLDSRRETIKLATRAVNMGAVIKEVGIDLKTGTRATVGTVVF